MNIKKNNTNKIFIYYMITIMIILIVIIVGQQIQIQQMQQKIKNKHNTNNLNNKVISDKNIQPEKIFSKPNNPVISETTIQPARISPLSPPKPPNQLPEKQSQSSIKQQQITDNGLTNLLQMRNDILQQIDNDPTIYPPLTIDTQNQMKTIIKERAKFIINILKEREKITELKDILQYYILNDINKLQEIVSHDQEIINRKDIIKILYDNLNMQAGTRSLEAVYGEIEMNTYCIQAVFTAWEDLHNISEDNHKIEEEKKIFSNEEVKNNYKNYMKKELETARKLLEQTKEILNNPEIQLTKEENKMLLRSRHTNRNKDNINSKEKKIQKMEQTINNFFSVQ